MRFNYLLRHSINFLKVVADDASDLRSVDEIDKLRLNASVKVFLDQGSFVAVDLDMGVLCSICSQILVVTLDLRTHRVPSRREVQEGEHWSLLV